MLHLGYLRTEKKNEKARKKSEVVNEWQKKIRKTDRIYKGMICEELSGTVNSDVVAMIFVLLSIYTHPPIYLYMGYPSWKLIGKLRE